MNMASSTQSPPPVLLINAIGNPEPVNVDWFNNGRQLPRIGESVDVGISPAPSVTNLIHSRNVTFVFLDTVPFSKYIDHQPHYG